MASLNGLDMACSIFMKSLQFFTVVLAKWQLELIGKGGISPRYVFLTSFLPAFYVVGAGL